MNEIQDSKLWELITSKLHGETNEFEATELDQLLEYEKNEKIFQDVKNIYENLPQTKSLNEVSLNRSWKKIISYFENKKRQLYWIFTKYAAIILLAFILGSLFNINWKSFHNAPHAFAEIKIPLGQMSEVTLYDGTHVWLNSGSTLTYQDNFGKNSRKVKLEGEAFFKVKHDKIPFKVCLKNSEVEVLGTSFAALSYKEDNFSQVTLVEGSIRINDLSGKKIEEIKPKQQICIPADINNYTIEKVDTRFYESWVDGKIIFVEERLADVTHRLQRWYNVEIKFDHPDTGNLRFSGTILKNKPFDQIVKAFSLLLPVKIEYQNNIEKKDIITISKTR